MAAEISCTSCSYRCKAKLDLIKHLFAAHSFEQNFKFQCGIKGCLYQFHSGATFSSFKTHVNRKHPNWQNCIGNPLSNCIMHSLQISISLWLDTTASTPIFHDISLDCEMPTPSTHFDSVEPNELFQPSINTNSDSYNSDNYEVKVPSASHTAALFLLTFKEDYRLSQRAIDFAVGSFSTMVHSVCESIQESVQSYLNSTNSTPDLTSCFDYEDPFSCLRTEYQQSKFYRQEFGLVVWKYLHIILANLASYLFFSS